MYLEAEEMNDSDNFYMVKKKVEVFKYEESDYKSWSRFVRIDLFAGTMIHLKLKDEKFAYVKIVKDDLSDKYSTYAKSDIIWVCDSSSLVRVNSKIYPLILPICLSKRIELLKTHTQQFWSFEIGDSVKVNLSKKTKKFYDATIRYKGKIPEKGPGIFFGLELEEHEGYTDGKFKDTHYFKCERNKGVFVTIDEIKPKPKTTKKGKMSKSNYSTSSSNFYSTENGWNSQDRTEKNQSFNDKKAKNLQCLANDSSTQVDEIDLKRQYGFIAYSPTNKNSTILDTLKYGEETPSTSPVLEIEEKYTREAYSDENSYSDEHYNGSNESEGNGYELMRELGITVGSPVEINHNGKPHFGVIRWIGSIDGELKAGIEMDKEDPEFTNGSYGNKSFFKCEPHTGFFVDVHRCHLDSRLSERVNYESRHNEDSNRESPVVNGIVQPISINSEAPSISGKYKGVQGHHNSCYLDATLFSMFTFTSVFDSLLYRPPSSSDIDHYEEVQSVLRDEIVNPLRKNNFVSADRVMKLRRLMEKLSSVSGLTTEEKDPEEFFTSLVAQILKADPFLKLSSGQEAFHYQLFVEKDEKLALPTVQQLFEQSFYASDIKLKEVPACLIIQMPRFGKSYKMYPRILPSQLLDVTDVIENSPRQCLVCGRLAKQECRNCFEGLGAKQESNLQNTAFCNECINTVHTHIKRTKHNWRNISAPPHVNPEKSIPRLYMELFAVVCIETSHYVTFVKCGDRSEAPWCFFDSMADREGEQDGFNIPEVVMCPELPNWLSEKGALNLQQFKDSQLPEHAKRLLCDAYMCMYLSPEAMMYR